MRTEQIQAFLLDVSTTPEERAAARRVLAGMDAMDLADMLGLTEGAPA